MKHWMMVSMVAVIVCAAACAQATDRYVAWDNATGASTPFLSWTVGQICPSCRPAEILTNSGSFHAERQKERN